MLHAIALATLGDDEVSRLIVAGYQKLIGHERQVHVSDGLIGKRTAALVVRLHRGAQVDDGAQTVIEENLDVAAR